MDVNEAARAFGELVEVVKALRTPGTGCPWDLDQDHRSLRRYLTEESAEVLEAIDLGDDPALRDELGDLLLQVVLHAQLADDRRAFSIAEVVRGITAKMVRRHPHVFGSATAADAAAVSRAWDEIKAAERGSGRARPVPPGLPALARAQRLWEKAKKANEPKTSERRGVSPPVADVIGELAVLPPDRDRATAERLLGEALFGLCRLATQHGINAEDCLRERTHRLEGEWAGEK